MLDPLTLGAVVFVLAIISSIVMTITWRMNLQERGLKMWAWAAIIGGLGFLPLPFAPLIGSYAAVLNNIATLIAPILILEGILRFRGYPRERLRRNIYILVIIYAVSFIFILRDSPNTRFLFYDSLNIVIFYLSAFLLLWKSGGVERKIYMLSAIPFVMIGSSFGVRWFLALNGSFEANFVAHPYTSYLFFVVIIWTVGWTYGLSLAVNYRNHTKVMKLATHDDMTGLANRKHLNHYLDSLLTDAETSNEPFVLYLLDLNGFKQINDTYGHNFGDQAIIQMAETIKELIDEHDFAARLGGDEFIIVSSRVSLNADVNKLKEKIRKSIERPARLDEQLIQLRTSIGYAMFPADGKNTDTLLSTADQRMYHDKTADRARSTVMKG
ncbi:GGDEF domain-containing protein [Jeotgalibacillus salarius]|uniref:GGDEF domain-containing protein n=1 Tax=Jeotgalibacillus salarius TaxID=546023 RepID=A0A4Y8LFP1_9BACL|nr:GGDEF domain-containing protein [Jeotgalibacillus salarius]TFD99816.1 GGDEF domain-containing protein [Jeotgalibacillus salarius]